MAVTYATAAKTARMTASRDAVAGGTLEILTAGGTVLSTHTLTGTGGSVSTDTWTLAFAANTVTAGATGTATQARIKNSAGTVIISGLTVGLAAATPDVVLDNTSVASGQNVTISSAAIQHAA